MIATSFAPMSSLTRSMSVLVVAPIALLTGTTEPPPSAPATDSPDLAEMVAMVPQTVFPGSGGELYYVDMSLAWERLGVGTDAAEREDNVGRFAQVEYYTIVPQLFLRQLFQFDEARAEIGFSVVEIERELAVLSPPDNLFIDATNVPASTIEAAIEHRPDVVIRADDGRDRVRYVLLLG